jgi:phosphate:Na+ symporter
MKKLENPCYGVLVGMVVTVIIQSSSATLGIIITLASQGMLSLEAGIAIMMGAEIGTCADTLIATIGRSKEAIRAGIFHLIFNITSVGLGILLINYLTNFVLLISSGADTARQLANAHVIFNVCGVLLFLPFTSFFAKALNTLIPDRSSNNPNVSRVSSV